MEFINQTVRRLVFLRLELVLITRFCLNIAPYIATITKVNFFSRRLGKSVISEEFLMISLSFAPLLHVFLGERRSGLLMFYATDDFVPAMVMWYRSKPTLTFGLYLKVRRYML